ncbi:hypothetical protein [Streptomyces sp. NPDC049813]|uniref:hypothetical protein n=1 Tax=Streptomyces sp. NPDC049813 TaxID=3365597 RepID=UPI0037938968
MSLVAAGALISAAGAVVPVAGTVVPVAGATVPVAGATVPVVGAVVPMAPAAYAVESLHARPVIAAEPSPHRSLAGSRAGVGRTPPGRPLAGTDVDEPVIPPSLPPPPPPSAPAEPSATAPPASHPEQSAADRPPVAARDTEPVVNVVPLGAGLLLTGLGIGFLALRLRR